MKAFRFLTVLLLSCCLLTITACNATPQEQTTIAASTEQTQTETMTETTTALETSVTTTSATTIPPANIKPIRSILLYTYNAYAASVSGYGYNFYYFTPERIAWGRTKKTPINTKDPLSTENMKLVVSAVPEDVIYETICEQMWELRFDRLPSRLDANRGLVMDHSEYYLIVTFEDGSSKTSSGYAITAIHETYQKVTNLLSCYANKFRNEAKSNN